MKRVLMAIDPESLWIIARRIGVALTAIVGTLVILVAAPIWFPLFCLYELGRSIEEDEK